MSAGIIDIGRTRGVTFVDWENENREIGLIAYRLLLGLTFLVCRYWGKCWSSFGLMRKLVGSSMSTVMIRGTSHPYRKKKCQR